MHFTCLFVYNIAYPRMFYVQIHTEMMVRVKQITITASSPSRWEWGN